MNLRLKPGSQYITYWQHMPGSEGQQWHLPVSVPFTFGVDENRIRSRVPLACGDWVLFGESTSLDPRVVDGAQHVEDVYVETDLRNLTQISIATLAQPNIMGMKNHGSRF